MTFDGSTFSAKLDQARLTRQLDRVAALMSDGHWHTLAGIAAAVEGSEAGVSARLRDLRKPRFGGKTVEGRRVDGGLWEYRLIQDGPLPGYGGTETTAPEIVAPGALERDNLFGEDLGPQAFFR